MAALSTITALTAASAASLTGAARLPLDVDLFGVPTTRKITLAQLRQTDYVFDVRDFGAAQDGVTDDGPAIQAACAAQFAAGRGVVVVSGASAINAARQPIVSMDGCYAGVIIPSGVRMQFLAGASLTVIPTAAPNYAPLMACDDVTDIRIDDPVIIGDVGQHIGTGGEYGFGIHLAACRRVVVSNARITDCWGDDILVGTDGYSARAYDVTLINPDLRLARRNAISATCAERLRIIGGYIEARGPGDVTTLTPPQAGFDIEALTQSAPNSDIVCVGTSFRTHPGAGDAVLIIGYQSGVRFIGCSFDAGTPYVYEAKERKALNVIPEAGLAGTPVEAVGCRFTGPVLSQGLLRASDCTFDMDSADPSSPFAVRLLRDYPSSLVNCDIIARGTSRLVEVDESTTDERAKVLDNVRAVQVGATSTAGAQKGYVRGRVRMRNVSFTHTGANPASPYYLDIQPSADTTLDNVFVHAQLGDPLVPGGGIATLDASTRRWQRGPVSDRATVTVDANAATTLTVFLSAGVQVQAVPITANRTITLSTTNAFDGATFRVKRLASATGAFTLGVGAVKTLAAGQWCEVQYNGATAAWELQSFGSL